MKFRTTGAVLSTIAASVLAIGIGSANAEILKAETGTPSGLTTVVPQMISKFASQQHGINLQVNSGQTLTKASFKTAVGKLDLTVTPPPAFSMMQAGKGPFKKSGQTAIDASQNLRSLFGFVGGYFRSVVWEDSGIKSFADFKGKRVFTGPPSGSANFQSTSIIRAASGLEPEKDYESVRLGWGAGLQAFEDGQFDVFMRPAPMGAAVIEQLGLKREIRLISIPEEALKTQAWKDFTDVPDKSEAVIPMGTYTGQTNRNQDVIVGSYGMQLTVNKSMDDDTAYKLTASFWDNIDDIKKSVAVLKAISADEPLFGVNVPLHPGAIRYFEEKGIAIPDHLRGSSS